MSGPSQETKETKHPVFDVVVKFHGDIQSLEAAGFRTIKVLDPGPPRRVRGLLSGDRFPALQAVPGVVGIDPYTEAHEHLNDSRKATRVDRIAFCSTATS